MGQQNVASWVSPLLPSPVYPLQQGLQEGIWGKGEAHNPRRRCSGLACQGHVAAMWQDPGVLAPLLPGL